MIEVGDRVKVDSESSLFRGFRGEVMEVFRFKIGESIYVNLDLVDAGKDYLRFREDELIRIP